MVVESEVQGCRGKMNIGRVLYIYLRALYGDEQVVICVEGGRKLFFFCDVFHNFKVEIHRTNILVRA